MSSNVPAAVLDHANAQNDRDTLDTPGFMQTVHNVRGLKLDGKDVWFCECSGERIALGDYGHYSNGNFKHDGNIFEDMQEINIDPADPAYHPVVSRVSSNLHTLHHKQDQHSVAVGHRGHYLILHSPKGLSLPNNQQLVLLLKALSMRLANKHLVTIIIQCSNLNCVDEEGNRKEAGGGSASLTGSDSMEPGVLVPLCTIASPQVWRREPACAQKREQFRSIREQFYTVVNLCRSSGTETGRESTSKRMNRDAVKFLSNIFGLESLKNYVGEITFFKELRSMLETQMQRGSIFVWNADAAGSRDGPSARRATSTWSPFRSRVALNPSKETVVPPLLERCKAFNPLVDLHRYLVARRQVRCEIKSISQTLGVGLLEYIYTTILDACQDEIIQDTAHARQVDIHSTLQEIKVLRTKLDTTDDEDEQRALEEDVTGKILWISWCGILSELEQLLAEVTNCIRREMDSMTPEGSDRFRQGLREIGDIIKKTTQHNDHNDDLGHLRRIMLDASTGISKQQLWLAARVQEQTKWSGIPVGRLTNGECNTLEVTSSDQEVLVRSSE